MKGMTPHFFTTLQYSRLCSRMKTIFPCLMLLTFFLWDKTWSRSCHPRRSRDLGPGSSRHRRCRRCGSGARKLGWPLHLSSHTTVAAGRNGKIYFTCGGVSPETWLTHPKNPIQLILELRPRGEPKTHIKSRPIGTSQVNRPILFPLSC